MVGVISSIIACGVIGDGCKSHTLHMGKPVRILNRNSNRCFICGIKNTKLEYHHILRIPEITIKVCHKCHRKIDDTNKYPDLKPKFTKKGKKFIKWTYNSVYKSGDVIIDIDNFKNFNGSHWVRFK